jgi:hypothetical protein
MTVSPSAQRPNFFIVGAPKCGTTALTHYLAQHPDIYLAKKEMHFFGADLHFGPQFYRRNEKAYLAEFADCHGCACAGEASVWYLFSREAAAEIKAFSPQARIIIMLREPAAMLYSLYHQFMLDGNEFLPSFAEALAAENDRSQGRRVPRQAYFIQGLVYRATARYTNQVRRYFEVFGRERVHVIIYDDFAANTAGAYQDTLKFLGLSAGPAKINFQLVNPASAPRSLFLRNLLNDPFLRRMAISMKSWLPPSLFAWGQKTGIRLALSNRRPAVRAPLPPELKLALRREFTPEVERLSALLGRDLTGWTKGDAANHDPSARVTGPSEYRSALAIEKQPLTVTQPTFNELSP